MSTIESTSTDKREVYARVTAQIIQSIEQGVGTWRMPWHTSGKFAFSRINVTSRKPYRGINTLCLWSAAQAKGYDSAEWGTYAQWQERKAQVRKGEKSTTVVFWKFVNDSKEGQDGETLSSSRLLFIVDTACSTLLRLTGMLPSRNRSPHARTHRPCGRIFHPHRCRSLARREPSVLRSGDGSHSNAAVRSVQGKRGLLLNPCP
jgi:antirestriction factor ArdC-like protein